jgi:hypothetical protein
MGACDRESAAQLVRRKNNRERCVKGFLSDAGPVSMRIRCSMADLMLVEVGEWRAIRAR